MDNTDYNLVETEKKIALSEIAVTDLIKRLLPDHYKQFEAKITEINGNDMFSIYNNSNDLVVLDGNNQVSVASALNWYLKYYSNCHIGWNGNQIKLSERLQKLNAPVTIKSQFKYRYYLNYCTFSYSTPWWNWERWEKEIDWMALNGINLVLSLVGQEAVWQKLFSEIGCDQKEVFEFLPGPAFNAWGWLNNLDGWGGPTTQNWVDDQKELQLKILERLRSLNITPVLQTFTGRVPRAFAKRFPEAQITKLKSWYDFDGVYFLDPSDPLFKKLGKLFFDVQNELYGNDHFFAGDIFHEIDSSDKSKDYMSRVYKGIQESLMEADKDAVWILQSWTIRDDSISVLDPNHTIVLDMFCETEPKWNKTDHFHGQPWIWSIINNFGGRTGLGGNIPKIVSDLQNAKEEIPSSKLIGIGIVPEGIENNVPVYELFMELNWHKEKINSEDWINKYSERRYGFTSANINNAWSILLDTVYSGPKGYTPIESVICSVPKFNIKNVSSNGSTEIYYSNLDLLKAAELLLSNAIYLKEIETYRYDVVDVTRQFGANLANRLFGKIISTYNQKDIDEFKKYSELFISLCWDLDELLASNKNFSLGSWLNSAKSKKKDENDLKLLEWNARRQITLWSSPEINEFHDYANKQWGGLIKDYYIPRWKCFFDYCLSSLTSKKDFNETDFNNWIISHAIEWSNKTNSYDVVNGKDEIKLAEKFVVNYKMYSENI